MIQAISFRGDRSSVPPRVKIGFESDNLVESLAFELPELAGDQTAMLMISGNAYANMIDLHRTEDGKWAVDLAAEMVGPAGVYESYVAITCPDGRRWNSGIFDLLTGDLPDISESVEALYPTAVEHVLQEMAETRQEMAASVTATEDAAQRAEDAAQRAENAANQGGGSEEAPAKDAVLYTAQELTEEQQMQARDNIGAASAEAVGKLYEDKADKSEIPEPYVLPTASADTLGGVKIGDGLQMDGDVLGVKPSNKLVLIDTITITEETSYIYVSKEPDGTPYAFTDLVVRIKAPAHPTAGNWSLYPFEGENGEKHSITLSGFPSTKGTYYGMFVCSVRNGFVEMTAWKDAYDTVFRTVQTTKVTAVNDVFRRVNLRSSGGIPVGTVIEIEGVRA